jgi:hypothetical protein
LKFGFFLPLLFLRAFHNHGYVRGQGELLPVIG